MAKIRRYQRRNPDGSRQDPIWIVDFVDPTTGKRHQLERRKRKDAEAKLREVLARIERGRRTIDSRLTFADACEQWSTWLDAQVKSGALTWRTAVDYRGKMKHALPHLGSLRLDKITVPSVHRLQDELIARDVSLVMVRRVLTVLSQFFGWAAQRGLVSHNPCANIQIRRRKDRVRAPHREQIYTVLEQCSEHRWKAFFTALAFTGMRAGEALALEWSDVDFERRLIHVCKSLDGRGGAKAPKTSSGERSVPFGPIVEEALTALPRSAPFVFPSKKGGYSDVVIAGKAWRRISGGICRMHDLRHFAVSLFIHAGLPVTAVSKFIGHANPTVTLGIYAHFFEDESYHEKIARVSALAQPGLRVIKSQ